MTVTPVTTPMTNPDAIPVAPSSLCVGNTSAEQRKSSINHIIC